MNNEVLLTIWKQLCRHVSALEFVKYLFKDVIHNQFMLESIGSRVVVDSDSIDIPSTESKQVTSKGSGELAAFVKKKGRPPRLINEELSEMSVHRNLAQSMEQSKRRNSLSMGEDQSSASVTRIKNRLANLTQLVWDEFFLCEPQKAQVENNKCACNNCFSESGPVSNKSKCKMIPSHLVFFCQQLHLQCLAKFKNDKDAQHPVVHFLFDEWLLQILCEDANKYGLLPYVHFDEVLRKNLLIVRMAINSLFLPDDVFQQSNLNLPPPIADVCENRRTQAKRFLADLLHHVIPAKTLEEQTRIVKVDAIIVNLSDLSVIFDFFYKLATNKIEMR